MEVTFILPLTLLPGVALLIVSTSTRYGQLHDEIHRFVQQPGQKQGQLHLRQRARHFRDALIGLYLCVSIFALTSLVGVTLEVLSLSSRWPIVILTSLGCISLFFAAYQLVRESFLSLEGLEEDLTDAGDPTKST
jgi:threonine/homoserine/homoserine lactone efflux protein